MSKNQWVEEERANWISHAVGILFGVVAGILIIANYFQFDDPIMKMSIWLYLFGMLSSFTASTVYHYSDLTSKWRPLLRKFDHSAIYWFIAGSYSPLVLIPMRDVGFWGWGIFIAVWVCALAGTIVTFLYMADMSHIKTACYVLMGLMIFIAFKPFWNSVTPSIFWWVVAEGVCYITGAVFYSIYKVKYLHTIFHIFVLAGAVCHFVAVWQLLGMYYG